MGQIIKYYQKLYKFHDEDIWGRLALNRKYSKALEYVAESYQRNFQKRRLIKHKIYFFKRKAFKHFFNYDSIEEKEPEFKRRMKNMSNREFLKRLQFKYFYGNIRLNSIKYFLKNGSNYSSLHNSALPLFLENRLSILLFRTGLFSSIFFLKQFVRHKNVLINGVPITMQHQSANINDIISIKPWKYFKFLLNYIRDFYNNRIFFPPASYLYINYKIGCLTLIKRPELSEIRYPLGIRAQRVVNLFLNND